ncbi:hypothetical protein NEF87_000036 [Candidatus Lokiarchaeum ossiferum]|uniref:DUF2283 domain-containing protein n=1 Tax=Candidatus Lokiarchaeum ossiferum TaxID=2951803 RepID=A0ABY6HJP6_9ARCH|nr:hypothetical protein NEF87_000036 [Candidatus Lokiarchaeum sp. B-35]
MDLESSSAQHAVYFDLSGDEIYINFKEHLDENHAFKQMIQVQTQQNNRINIDLMDNNNQIQLNTCNLKKILKHF